MSSEDPKILLEMTISEVPTLEWALEMLEEGLSQAIFNRGPGADNTGLQSSLDCTRDLLARLRSKIPPSEPEKPKRGKRK